MVEKVIRHRVGSQIAGKANIQMSAGSTTHTAYTMAEFIGTMLDGETFACPTHAGRKAGNFSANGTKNHITWCADMQAAYAVTPTKATATKAKPTAEEDRALRGWASKPRTIRRDARQAEKPVGRQDNSVKSVGRVRVTGGYVDPATITVSDWNLDKNGNVLKGKALKNRVEKLLRNGDAVKNVESKASTPEPTSQDMHDVASAESVDNRFDEVIGRLNKVEAEIARFAPVVEALEGYVAAQDDMIESATA